MPHLLNTGTIHKCIGKTGGVTIHNKNGTVKSFIQQGNCRPTGPGWCGTHEHYCERHDWVYSKKEQCVVCVGEKRARAEAWERNKHRKRDEPRLEEAVEAAVVPKGTPRKKNCGGSTRTAVKQLREEKKREKTHRRRTEDGSGG